MDEGALMQSGSTVDDRGQLAECLAFISDMALTGDAEGGHQGSVGVLPGTCQQRAQPDDDDDNNVAREATGEQPDDETVPEPADSGVAAGAGGRAHWLRHRLTRLRLQRQRSAPAPTALSASVDDSVSSHIQMLNSLDSQDDDSQDWAEMRSWLVWCLRDKLGDADVLSDGPRRQSPVSSSRAGSITSRGPRQLVRQQAVHERSPRIGVVDCSGPTPPGSAPAGRHLLRCRSAETRGERLYDTSLDGSAGDSAGSVPGRLTVGASCSGQSSFESYGSAG